MKLFSELLVPVDQSCLLYDWLSSPSTLALVFHITCYFGTLYLRMLGIPPSRSICCSTV